MKVYSCPAECPAPTPDYSGKFDYKKELEQEEKHMKDLKEWLIKRGYRGKLTGEIVSFGVADGQALYMLADGSKSCLIHLPYGDAYAYHNIKYLPKNAIVKRIVQIKQLNALFTKKD